MPDRKKQVPHTRQERDAGSSHFPPLLVLAIFLAAIVVKLLLPEFEAAVCYLLMGPEGNPAEVAFCELRDQFAQGAPMEEAVSAFCQEVMGAG